MNKYEQSIKESLSFLKQWSPAVYEDTLRELLAVNVKSYDAGRELGALSARMMQGNHRAWPELAPSSPFQCGYRSGWNKQLGVCDKAIFNMNSGIVDIQQN